VIAELLSIVKVSIFQPRCKLCDNILVSRDEKIICNECKSKIKINLEPVCRKCGKLLNIDGDLCGECLINPPIFRKHISYSIYEGEIRDLILLYKYLEIEKLKKLIASCYIELFYKKVDEEFDFIIPVPSDDGRKREYDHILEVSKILSKELGIRLLPNNLIKIKRTLPQAGLSMRKRLNNLNKAFKLNDPVEISKKKILLIDDVYTTGTTVKKCAGLMKRVKADVIVLTLARSV